MLKIIQIDKEVFDYKWSISPLNGSLYKNLKEDGKLENLQKNLLVPSKVENALRFVDHPYDLTPVPAKTPDLINKAPNKKAQVIYSRLRKISNKNFLTSIVYSSFKRHIFNHTSEAFEFLAGLPSESDIQDNCFQKALFVAKTSKSFYDNGVIFVGAQVPTAQMHAWVIEGDYQYDYSDRVWVNYTPLLAITY